MFTGVRGRTERWHETILAQVLATEQGSRGGARRAMAAQRAHVALVIVSTGKLAV